MDNFKTFANSFQAVAKPGLESIRTLLEIMGNPQKKLKYIHIAGTNGKGSVCAYLQKILTKAGYKTGKYTSPNLISVCERIVVGDTLISETEMNDLLSEMEGYVKKIPQNLAPTQFEIWTAAAFLYFVRQNCDIVVLETGLGGEKDATNIIDENICSIITKIGIDHIEYLGDNISGIAAAKAGIIKPGGFCVTTPKNASVMQVIAEAAKKNENELFITDEPVLIGHEDCREIFSYKNIKNITSGLCGMHQTENACLAAEAALHLNIPEDIIKSGIMEATHPARFERIGENIIYDGAHNADGVRSLTDNLKRYFGDRELTFIFSCMGDKDMSKEFEILTGLNIRKMYTVRVKDNPRAADAEIVAEKAAEYGISAVAKRSIEEAVMAAKMENTLIVICGSLYLYKDFAQIKNKI